MFVIIAVIEPSARHASNRGEKNAACSVFGDSGARCKLFSCLVRQAETVVGSDDDGHDGR